MGVAAERINKTPATLTTNAAASVSSARQLTT
jgi:hypothetical protein